MGRGFSPDADENQVSAARFLIPQLTSVLHTNVVAGRLRPAPVLHHPNLLSEIGRSHYELRVYIFE